MDLEDRIQAREARSILANLLETGIWNDSGNCAATLGTPVGSRRKRGGDWHGSNGVRVADRLGTGVDGSASGYAGKGSLEEVENNHREKNSDEGKSEATVSLPTVTIPV